MAAAAVTCALPPRGRGRVWLQRLGASGPARSSAPTAAIGCGAALQSRRWPMGVRERCGCSEAGRNRAFPGRRLGCRVRGAGVALGRGGLALSPLCDPGGPGVRPENGNPHPREAADIRARPGGGGLPESSGSMSGPCRGSSRTSEGHRLGHVGAAQLLPAAGHRRPEREATLQGHAESSLMVPLKGRTGAPPRTGLPPCPVGPRRAALSPLVTR